MAEVAIPMAVLGVMYIISNKDKEDWKNFLEKYHKPLQKPNLYY